MSKKDRIFPLIRQRVPDRVIVERVGCSTSYVAKLRCIANLPGVERNKRRKCQ